MVLHLPVKPQQSKESSFLVKDGIEIKQDEGTDIWLSTYSSDPALIYGTPRSGTVNLLGGFF
jgi:hypothetical protein